MNSQYNQHAHTLVLLAVVFAVISLILCYSIPSVAKKHAKPGNPHDGTIQLGPGDNVWPEEGDDNTGDDRVLGGEGDDALWGGDGNDNLRGEAGEDWLYGEAGKDRLYGDDGNDFLKGGDEKDWLYGGAGIDYLDGEAGNDALYVESLGSSVCDGDLESCDFADGGEGYDYLIVFLDTVIVWFPDSPRPDNPCPEELGCYLGSYYDKNDGDIPVQGYFKNIEKICGSTLGGIIYGNDDPNEIGGRDGNDLIYGYGGDDDLSGGDIGLSPGLLEEEQSDELHGGDGNDRIEGSLGDDWLYGEDGDDFLYGGKDDDYIIGGLGDDKIFIREGEGNDIVEDFMQGEDKIVIYDSKIVWEDLTVTAIDADGDGLDDTLVAWRVKNKSASVTLLNLYFENLSSEDFIFDQ